MPVVDPVGLGEAGEGCGGEDASGILFTDFVGEFEEIGTGVGDGLVEGARMARHGDGGVEVEVEGEVSEGSEAGDEAPL